MSSDRSGRRRRVQQRLQIAGGETEQLQVEIPLLQSLQFGNEAVGVQSDSRVVWLSAVR